MFLTRKIYILIAKEEYSFMATISQIKVSNTTYDIKANYISPGTNNFLVKYTTGSTGAIGDSTLCNIANISYSTITPDYTSGGETFYKAWLTYISKNYNNADLFLGTANPNSKGPIFGNIYDNSDRDATTELPRYSTFIFHNLAGDLETFGTHNYNYYHRNILSDNNYTSYTVTKTGSGASGTWGISISGNSATASGIKDAGDSRTLTAAYSKNGLNYGDYSWLAAWNGNELRAVAKSQFAASTEVISRKAWWTSGNGNNVDTLKGGVTFAYTNHNAPTTGTIAAFDCSTNENYSLQLMGGYSDNTLFFRSRNGDNGTWHGWRAVTPMSAENGYWGLKTAGGGEDWIRTTQNGLIPYRSGGSGSGHCGLGTSSWYFSSAYIDSVYVTSGAAGFKCRNISYGTGAPSGGANGDVYIQYS